MFDTSAVKLRTGSAGGRMTTHVITCAHSRTPFQGSVSGTAVVHGLHGESLGSGCGFYDISHLGLGRRHRMRLIELPSLFTSAYQQVSQSMGVLFPCLYVLILS
jgi:hypothetical protein